LPTDTAVIFVIDRVDSNGTTTPAAEETIIGVVSGTNVVTCIRGVEGTAQAHNAGAVVELLFTASHWNKLITALLTEHGQLGTHTNITGSNITASGTTTASHVTASDITTRTISASNITASQVTACNATLDTVTARTTNGDLTLAGAGTGKVKENARYGAITAVSIVSSSAVIDTAITNQHSVTLASGVSTTIVASNVSVGQVFSIRLLQPSAGSSGVASWFTTIKWAGGVAPTLTTTNAKADWVGFVCTGSGTYDGFVIGQNI
jgi:hypothetical protein